MLLTASLIEDVEGEAPTNVMIGAYGGKTIRFPHDIVRPIGRTATGVKGITLDEGDYVIGMITVRPEQDVLVVSENGYGKRSSIEDYRVTNRGGKGVKTLNITEKTGNLISVNAVTDNDHLMIINRSGITIRLAVDTLRVMGRATQGVRLINLRDGDVIASVAKIEGGAELERIAEEEAAKIAQMEAEADGIVPAENQEEVVPEENGAEIAEEENNENTNE